MILEGAEFGGVGKCCLEGNFHRIVEEQKRKVTGVSITGSRIDAPAAAHYDPYGLYSVREMEALSKSLLCEENGSFI